MRDIGKEMNEGELRLRREVERESDLPSLPPSVEGEECGDHQAGEAAGRKGRDNCITPSRGGLTQEESHPKGGAGNGRKLSQGTSDYFLWGKTVIWDIGLGLSQ